MLLQSLLYYKFHPAGGLFEMVFHDSVNGEFHHFQAGLLSRKASFGIAELICVIAFCN
jgi:hypothetical protein